MPNRKASIILRGFGLQALKAKVYNFGEEEPDTAPKPPDSYLGTPVFSDVDFIEGQYTNLDGELIAYEGFTVDTVLISVNMSRNIVRTPIQGRNGTQKEYISDGDHDITIRGLIVDESSLKYPQEQVQALAEICKVQKELQIASRFLNDVFGVHDVVISSYSFPQLEGVQHVQPFEIQCFSDDPIELTINRR